MSIDTNINNFTISELISILQLNDNFNKDSVITKSQIYIDKFKNNSNFKMEQFFIDIQKKLLNFLGDEPQIDPIEKQTNNWFKNEYLEQSNNVQASKNTDRKQKIEVYNNEHNPINREKLGVSNTFNVPIAQDSLNPNLKNVIQRFINLDSQFRQTGTISTDYTLDLSDHLNDVLSLRLYSFQIPITWYTIDEQYGNTCFWITDGSYNIPITIIPGNYTSTTIVNSLNYYILNNGFTNNTDPNWIPVSYNSINGKLTLNFINAEYNGPNPDKINEIIHFNITSETIITFFDYTSKLQCKTACINNNYYINYTLGWIMGFRLPYINVDPYGNTAPAILDLNGSKYFILVIDDFNQNHINNGLVSITELSKKLKLPSYYSPDLPYTCIGSNKFTSNLQSNINSVDSTNVNSGELVMEKLNTSYNVYSQILPSAPRTLTQSQIYTINEIIKNNDRTTNYKTKAPTTSDVFALIPIKGGQSLGTLYVDFGGTLQDFKRIYFGPVDIDRLRVTLLDDKGNIVNLNGSEWSITLIADILYQY